MASRFNPPIEIDVVKLLLDTKNPRIPRNQQSLSQDQLTVYVAENYFALAIARSITSHQYFSSEPLIAIPAPRGHFVVVEGNRRLAALKLLLNPDLRKKLEERSDWDALPLTNVPTRVPVVRVAKRRDVAPIIGYRHISGIQPWDAHAKARYIADQIDSGLSVKETADEVGETESEVRTNYRNYRIAVQAERSRIEPKALADMKGGFGVFTRAMQAANIRNFIGAPMAVARGKNPIPPDKKSALKEMVEMLFGPRAVLEDSRDITKLGKVVASKDGLKALRQGRNLEEALVASGGVRDRLIDRLSNAARNLRAAKEDIPKYKRDQEVKDLLAQNVEALEALSKIAK